MTSIPRNDSASAAPGVILPNIGRDTSIPLSSNEHLLRWVEKMAQLTQPAAIHWVDGSKEEDEALKAQMVAGGTFVKLNEELWPGCYYARSDASDVARVEDRTYICSLSKDIRSRSSSRRRACAWSRRGRFSPGSSGA